MAILFLLIALSSMVALGFLYFFVWAVKDGQYDDDVTPAMRMLLDDELVQPKPSDTKQNDHRSKN